MSAPKSANTDKALQKWVQNNLGLDEQEHGTPGGEGQVAVVLSAESHDLVARRGHEVVCVLHRAAVQRVRERVRVRRRPRSHSGPLESFPLVKRVGQRSEAPGGEGAEVKDVEVGMR